VQVAKAVEIFEQFEQSKQFWGYAVRSGMIDTPSDFITSIPHVSFVYGQEQVDFLKSRYEQLSRHHFFKAMEFTEDRAVIKEWAPLLLDERDDTPIAATRIHAGTDVNFGELSRKLIHWLDDQENCGVHTGHRVTDLKRCEQGWEVSVKDLSSGKSFKQKAKFVFIGAGGGSLPLLQKSGIDESKGFGGFPIGGQWLICEKPEVVEQHQAKVYGMSPGAAPTMAVPHLDTRIINGKKALLFGPYASWTTKFLHKGGCFTDLPLSIRPDNIFSLMKVGLYNIPLVRYLIQQGLQSMETRMKELRAFYPGAKTADWELIDAGIRVQAIKKEDGDAGIVHFGTEVVTSADKTVSALLGASPGASVTVNIVLEVISKSFPDLMKSEVGSAAIKEMVPAFGLDLKEPSQAEAQKKWSNEAEDSLQLQS
jgi:malate dehydrogenase (quinone)